MPAMKPEQCDVLMGEAINNKDLDAMVALYEPNGAFVLDSGEVVYGLDAVREALRPFAQAEGFRWLKLNAFPDADNSLAILRGTWAVNGKDAEGNVIEITGNNVEIVRRQLDGTWLFVIDHPRGAD